MSKFKQKIAGMGDQATKNTTPKEKVGRKKKIKEVMKTKERALKHTNFSNLIDRRPRRRKDRIPIITMKILKYCPNEYFKIDSRHSRLFLLTTNMKI